MALYPLHQAFGVTRIFASSYQAVSGTGAQAIEELAKQSREWASPKPRLGCGEAGHALLGVSVSDRLQRAAAGG